MKLAHKIRVNLLICEETDCPMNLHNGCRASKCIKIVGYRHFTIISKGERINENK